MRALILGLVAGLVAASATRAGDEGGSAEGVPPAFAPLEYLVGAWKGTAVPAANKVRGWPERHLWAWRFVDGKPAGMAVTFEGSKGLAGGILDVDAAGKVYKLQATDAAGKAVIYAGKLSADGKLLTLDREGPASDGARERLILRLLSGDAVRYNLWIDRRAKGAPQYKRAVEVGLTREGEAFAAGGSAEALPKCIVTGGAAAQSVSVDGVSYPICCSGCRDEFLENPAKYIARAKARREAGDSAKK